MAEKVNSKRAKFPRGLQRRFIQKVLMHLSSEKVADLCGVSQRTIRDWRREKFLMSEKALQMLAHKTGVVPGVVRFLPRYWYAAKGAKKGWAAVKEKYGRVPGNEALRQKRWREWWEREGKRRFHPIINRPKPIQHPRYSKELAEFVGILLGDGGITEYQVIVTLHSVKEKKYAQFIATVAKKLFGVPAVICPRKEYLALDVKISRVELVRFCTRKLGLKKGNKVRQQVDIPAWVKRTKEYLLSCVRGLMDTDGTVFMHRYKVNGKLYSYKKLSFTSHSKPLLDSMFEALQVLGFHPRRADLDVRLDRIDDVRRYFYIVGTHNPWHLKRYRN